MTLFAFEGFETIGTALGQPNHTLVIPELQKRYDVGQGINPTNDSPYLATGHDPSLFGLAFDGGGTYIRFPMPPGHATNVDTDPPETCIGMWYKTRTAAGIHNLLSIRQGSNGGVDDQEDSAECLFLSVHNGVSIQAGRSAVNFTANNILAPNQWHHIEFRFLLHNSAGELEVKVNGVTVISQSGIDTRQDNNRYMPTNIRVGHSAGTALGLVDVPIVDDIWITDGEFLGALTAVRVDVISDTTADWTPTPAGTLFSTIDENPNDANDYIEGDPGETASFSLATLPPGSVEAISMEVEATGEGDLRIFMDATETTVAPSFSSQVFKLMADTVPSTVGVENV